jgi:hypothetical protein
MNLRFSRKTRSIGATILVFAAAAAYFLAMSRGGHGRNLGAILRKYEFTELVPPSTLVGPGAIVTIVKTNPIVIGVVCPGVESLGPMLQTNVIASESASAKEIAELTGSFQLSGSVEEAIAANVDSKFVKTVTVTLSNVRIIEIPDSAVFKLLSHREDFCSKAIAFRKGKGQAVSMVKAAIQATAVYRVEFAADVQAGARAGMTRKIAGSLGVTNGVKSDDVIEGDDLIWGLRDDVDLAEVALAATPPPTGSLHHRRALPSNAPAAAVLDDK